VSHGIAGTFTDEAWVSATRTPPLYPDAVTLRRAADADAVLAALDSGPGCSVKDSFADLHLDRHGFRPVVEASWWRLTGARDRRAGWRAIRPGELAAWERAWSEAEPTGFFRPSLLEDPSISVLAQFAGDEVIGGAVASHAAGVTGLTNVFGDAAWAAAAAFAPAGEPVVCWEVDRPPGSETIGALVVWANP
jgi:hypothetical protein